MKLYGNKDEEKSRSQKADRNCSSLLKSSVEDIAADLAMTTKVDE